MLRKVVLEHGGQQYQGTVRNLSTTGALVEGLWNVPVGTLFRLHWAEGQVLTATTRWSQQDRMGIEFATPLANQPGSDQPALRGSDAFADRRRAVGS